MGKILRLSMTRSCSLHLSLFANIFSICSIFLFSYFSLSMSRPSCTFIWLKRLSLSFLSILFSLWYCSICFFIKLYLSLPSYIVFLSSSSILYSSWSFTKLQLDATDLLFSALSRLSTRRLLLLWLYYFSLPAFKLTFTFFILQVKTCRLEPFWLALSSPLALLLPIYFWLRRAGPPKIERNFFKEFDLTVSTSRASEAQRLEWCASLPLGILADCWYLEVF